MKKMMKTNKATGLIEIALPALGKRARAKRWVVTVVNRPPDDRDEFLTENEVWARASRLAPLLLVEKVEPKK